MTLLSDFTRCIAPYLHQDSRHFIVSYSGGIDSQVLLDLAVKMVADFPEHNLSAIHVNHGLSENAQHWQDFCQMQCRQLNVPLQMVQVEVDGDKGIEAAARKARYQALIDHAPADSIVLLGQHQDDQLETVLLQLKRGAGPKGLAAMPFESVRQNNITFVRPLLNITRQQIGNYAHSHGLTWQEDESNQNTRFERNFLRHDVIPVLKQKWPEIASAVSRTARLCAEQQALLDEISEARLNTIRNQDNSLDITGLTAYSDHWVFQIVRLWLTQHNVPLPSQAILQELPKLLYASEDANPVVSWQTWQFRRFQQKLYLLPQCTVPSEQMILLKPGQSLELPQNDVELHLSQQVTEGMQGMFINPRGQNLRVCYGGYGQKFKPSGALQSKPLKQWFKTWAVPPWERERVPLVFIDSELVAIILGNKLVLDQHDADSGGLYLQFKSLI